MKWKERLQNNKPLNKTDEDLSANWFTCACGELVPKAWFDSFGEPGNRDLRKYGYSFFEEVRNQDAGAAFEQYVKIENLVWEIFNDPERRRLMEPF